MNTPLNVISIRPFRWRVWLHGQDKAVEVTTSQNVLMHATAAAIDALGISSKRLIQPKRIELLDANGDVEAAWNMK